MTQRSTTLFFLASALAAVTSADAFACRSTTNNAIDKLRTQPRGASAMTTAPNTSTSSSTTRLLADGTGGWGMANSRDMVPEEFAKGGERNAFEGYNLRERGEFMLSVKQDKDDMKKSELAELLGVAGIAGINVKDPSTRMNKFQMDDGDFGTDNDDLDVRVEWEAPDPFARRRVRKTGVDDSTLF
jgi:hypothetical protein